MTNRVFPGVIKVALVLLASFEIVRAQTSGASPQLAEKPEKSTSAPTSSTAVGGGLSVVNRSILPLVALPTGDGDYLFLANSLVAGGGGRGVAPAHPILALSPDQFLPVSRLGVLVPRKDESLNSLVAKDRTFQRVRVIRIVASLDLALLEVEGGLGGIAPLAAGSDLPLGAHAQIYGFGEPGITRYVSGKCCGAVAVAGPW